MANLFDRFKETVKDFADRTSDQQTIDSDGSSLTIANVTPKSAGIPSTSAEIVSVNSQDGGNVSQKEKSVHVESKVPDISKITKTESPFIIPKKKSQSSGIFVDLMVSSRDFQREILPTIVKSYRNVQSTNKYVYIKVQSIQNHELQNLYFEKKKELRNNGYSEKELGDCVAFLCVDTEEEMARICRHGLNVGNSPSSCLGHPQMGVQLCKHADILRPFPLPSNFHGYLILFKIMKGRVKMVPENRSGNHLEPTPHYDCHMSNAVLSNGQHSNTHALYESSQVYLYEYGEENIIERPKNVCPVAVVQFTCDKDYKEAKPQLLPSIRSPPITTPRSHVPLSNGSSGKTHDDQEYVVWSGNLTVKGLYACSVEMRSAASFTKPAKLGTHVNITHKMDIQQVRRKYLHNVSNINKHCESLWNGYSVNVCELHPVASEGRSHFQRVMKYLGKQNSVAIQKLEKNVTLLMLTASELTYQLGLSKPHQYPVLLYCIFLSKKSTKTGSTTGTRILKSAGHVTCEKTGNIYINVQHNSMDQSSSSPKPLSVNVAPPSSSASTSRDSRQHALITQSPSSNLVSLPPSFFSPPIGFNARGSPSHASQMPRNSSPSSPSSVCYQSHPWPSNQAPIQSPVHIPGNNFWPSHPLPPQVNGNTSAVPPPSPSTVMPLSSSTLPPSPVLSMRGSPIVPQSRTPPVCPLPFIDDNLRRAFKQSPQLGQASPFHEPSSQKLSARSPPPHVPLPYPGVTSSPQQWKDSHSPLIDPRVQSTPSINSPPFFPPPPGSRMGFPPPSPGSVSHTHLVSKDPSVSNLPPHSSETRHAQFNSKINESHAWKGHSSTLSPADTRQTGPISISLDPRQSSSNSPGGSRSYRSQSSPGSFLRDSSLLSPSVSASSTQGYSAAHAEDWPDKFQVSVPCGGLPDPPKVKRVLEVPEKYDEGFVRVPPPTSLLKKERVKKEFEDQIKTVELQYLAIQAVKHGLLSPKSSLKKRTKSTDQNVDHFDESMEQIVKKFNARNTRKEVRKKSHEAKKQKTEIPDEVVSDVSGMKNFLDSSLDKPHSHTSSSSSKSKSAETKKEKESDMESGKLEKAKPEKEKTKVEKEPPGKQEKEKVKGEKDKVFVQGFNLDLLEDITKMRMLTDRKIQRENERLAKMKQKEKEDVETGTKKKRTKDSAHEEDLRVEHESGEALMPQSKRVKIDTANDMKDFLNMSLEEEEDHEKGSRKHSTEVKETMEKETSVTGNVKKNEAEVNSSGKTQYINLIEEIEDLKKELKHREKADKKSDKGKHKSVRPDHDEKVASGKAKKQKQDDPRKKPGKTDTDKNHHVSETEEEKLSRWDSVRKIKERKLSSDVGSDGEGGRKVEEKKGGKIIIIKEVKVKHVDKVKQKTHDHGKGPEDLREKSTKEHDMGRVQRKEKQSQVKGKHSDAKRGSDQVKKSKKLSALVKYSDSDTGSEKSYDSRSTDSSSHSRGRQGRGSRKRDSSESRTSTETNYNKQRDRSRESSSYRHGKGALSRKETRNLGPRSSVGLAPKVTTHEGRQQKSDQAKGKTSISSNHSAKMKSWAEERKAQQAIIDGIITTSGEIKSVAKLPKIPKKGRASAKPSVCVNSSCSSDHPHSSIKDLKKDGVQSPGIHTPTSIPNLPQVSSTAAPPGGDDKSVKEPASCDEGGDGSGTDFEEHLSKRIKLDSNDSKTLDASKKSSKRKKKMNLNKVEKDVNSVMQSLMSGILPRKNHRKEVEAKSLSETQESEDVFINDNSGRYTTDLLEMHIDLGDSDQRLQHSDHHSVSLKECLPIKEKMSESEGNSNDSDVFQGKYTLTGLHDNSLVCTVNRSLNAAVTVSLDSPGFSKGNFSIFDNIPSLTKHDSNCECGTGEDYVAEVYRQVDMVIKDNKMRVTIKNDAPLDAPRKSVEQIISDCIHGHDDKKLSPDEITMIRTIEGVIHRTKSLNFHSDDRLVAVDEQTKGNNSSICLESSVTIESWRNGSKSKSDGSCVVKSTDADIPHKNEYQTHTNDRKLAVNSKSLEDYQKISIVGSSIETTLNPEVSTYSSLHVTSVKDEKCQECQSNEVTTTGEVEEIPKISKIKPGQYENEAVNISKEPGASSSQTTKTEILDPPIDVQQDTRPNDTNLNLLTLHKEFYSVLGEQITSMKLNLNESCGNENEIIQNHDKDKADALMTDTAKGSDANKESSTGDHCQISTKVIDDQTRPSSGLGQKVEGARSLDNNQSIAADMQNKANVDIASSSQSSIQKQNQTTDESENTKSDFWCKVLSLPGISGTGSSYSSLELFRKTEEDCIVSSSNVEIPPGKIDLHSDQKTNEEKMKESSDKFGTDLQNAVTHNAIEKDNLKRSNTLSAETTKTTNVEKIPPQGAQVMTTSSGKVIACSKNVVNASSDLKLSLIEGSELKCGPSQECKFIKGDKCDVVGQLITDRASTPCGGDSSQTGEGRMQNQLSKSTPITSKYESKNKSNFNDAQNKVVEAVHLERTSGSSLKCQESMPLPIRNGNENKTSRHEESDTVTETGNTGDTSAESGKTEAKPSVSSCVSERNGDKSTSNIPETQKGVVETFSSIKTSKSEKESHPCKPKLDANTNENNRSKGEVKQSRTVEPLCPVESLESKKKGVLSKPSPIRSTSRNDSRPVDVTKSKVVEPLYLVEDLESKSMSSKMSESSKLSTTSSNKGKKFEKIDFTDLVTVGSPEGPRRGDQKSKDNQKVLATGSQGLASQAGPIREKDNKGARKRHHPYRKEKRKNTWSFDIPYNSLQELMQNLTVCSYKQRNLTKKTEAPRRKGIRAKSRFAHYRFVRSAVPDSLPESSEESDEWTESAIPNYEARKQKASMLDQMTTLTEDAAFDNEKNVYVGNNEQSSTTKQQREKPEVGKSSTSEKEPVQSRLQKLANMQVSCEVKGASPKADETAKSGRKVVLSIPESPTQSGSVCTSTDDGDHIPDTDLRNFLNKIKQEKQKKISGSPTTEAVPHSPVAIPERIPEMLANNMQSSPVIEVQKFPSNSKTLEYKLTPVEVDLNRNFTYRPGKGIDPCRLLSKDSWYEDPRMSKNEQIFNDDKEGLREGNGQSASDLDPESTCDEPSTEWIIVDEVDDTLAGSGGETVIQLSSENRKSEKGDTSDKRKEVKIKSDEKSKEKDTSMRKSQGIDANVVQQKSMEQVTSIIVETADKQNKKKICDSGAGKDKKEEIGLCLNVKPTCDSNMGKSRDMGIVTVGKKATESLNITENVVCQSKIHDKCKTEELDDMASGQNCDATEENIHDMNSTREDDKVVEKPTGTGVSKEYYDPKGNINDMDVIEAHDTCGKTKEPKEETKCDMTLKIIHDTDLKDIPCSSVEKNDMKITVKHDTELASSHECKQELAKNTKLDRVDEVSVEDCAADDLTSTLLEEKIQKADKEVRGIDENTCNVTDVEKVHCTLEMKNRTLDDDAVCNEDVDITNGSYFTVTREGEVATEETGTEQGSHNGNMNLAKISAEEEDDNGISVIKEVVVEEPPKSTDEGVKHDSPVNVAYEIVEHRTNGVEMLPGTTAPLSACYTGMTENRHEKKALVQEDVEKEKEQYSTDDDATEGKEMVAHHSNTESASDGESAELSSSCSVQKRKNLTLCYSQTLMDSVGDKTVCRSDHQDDKTNNISHSYLQSTNNDRNSSDQLDVGKCDQERTSSSPKTENESSIEIFDSMSEKLVPKKKIKPYSENWDAYCKIISSHLEERLQIRCVVTEVVNVIVNQIEEKIKPNEPPCSNCIDKSCVTEKQHGDYDDVMQFSESKSSSETLLDNKSTPLTMHSGDQLFADRTPSCEDGSKSLNTEHQFEDIMSVIGNESTNISQCDTGSTFESCSIYSGGHYTSVPASVALCGQKLDPLEEAMLSSGILVTAAVPSENVNEMDLLQDSKSCSQSTCTKDVQQCLVEEITKGNVDTDWKHAWYGYSEISPNSEFTKVNDFASQPFKNLTINSESGLSTSNELPSSENVISTIKPPENTDSETMSTDEMNSSSTTDYVTDSEGDSSCKLDGTDLSTLIVSEHAKVCNFSETLPKFSNAGLLDNGSVINTFVSSKADVSRNTLIRNGGTSNTVIDTCNFNGTKNSSLKMPLLTNSGRQSPLVQPVTPMTAGPRLPNLVTDKPANLPLGTLQEANIGHLAPTQCLSLLSRDPMHFAPSSVSLLAQNLQRQLYRHVETNMSLFNTHQLPIVPHPLYFPILDGMNFIQRAYQSTMPYNHSLMTSAPNSYTAGDLVSEGVRVTDLTNEQYKHLYPSNSVGFGNYSNVFLQYIINQQQSNLCQLQQNTDTLRMNRPFSYIPPDLERHSVTYQNHDFDYYHKLKNSSEPATPYSSSERYLMHEVPSSSKASESEVTIPYTTHNSEQVSKPALPPISSFAYSYGINKSHLAFEDDKNSTFRPTQFTKSGDATSVILSPSLPNVLDLSKSKEVVESGNKDIISSIPVGHVKPFRKPYAEQD